MGQVGDEGYTPKKQLKAFEKDFGCSTRFFSTYSPDLIEERMLMQLKSVGWDKDIDVKDDKYKIKFTGSHVEKGEKDEEVPRSAQI